jgi:OmcA/MtrC family decaheme c-type cytochrome
MEEKAIMGKKLSSLFLALLLAVMVGLLVGCEGDDGAPGADGTNGTNGLSAYEIAVQNGFTGTEADYLAAIENSTDESCNVCHGENAVADVAVVHPMLIKPEVSNIVVSRAGDILTVTFDVTADGDPVEGIGSGGPFGINGSTDSDLRVYMASIVPAGTVTANAPQTTWGNDYLESWAEERGTGSGGVIAETAPGSYSFTMGTPITAIGGVDAPDALPTDMQRVYVRADARDFEGLNRTMGVADFMIPADGASTAVLADGDTTRTIVTMEACTQCHGDPLERAAHGGGYQSPQVCNICHSPIGERGDEMQADGAWLASLIHGIHQATADTTAWDWSEVTYPRHPSDCGVCHFDAGQDAYADWTIPKVETCTTCHNVGPTEHPYDQADDSLCSACHTPGSNIIGGVEVGVTEVHKVKTLKNDPAHEGNIVSNVHAYEASLDITAPANGNFYVAGEAPVVTVTATNHVAADYTTAPADGGVFTAANVYVYGPRSHPFPILTPGSTTDPAFDPATMTADQGRSMLISAAADDPNVLTDTLGFKYQLQAIPDDLAAGTYMVMAYATDLTNCSAVYRGSVCIDGWVYQTIQIGTATEDLKVAGDCAGCHDPQDWSTFYHRSYFGTDGCIACHDHSGNHANVIANRVHAVHAASATGDLLGADWSGGDPEIERIEFPRNAYACEACHTSGNTSYIAESAQPVGWYVPCIGCHGDTPGANAHMNQNGGGLGTH